MKMCFSGVIALLSLHALNNLHIFTALAQGASSVPQPTGPLANLLWLTQTISYSHTSPLAPPEWARTMAEEPVPWQYWELHDRPITQPQPALSIVTIAHHRPNFLHICPHLEAYGKGSLCRSQHWGLSSLKINLYPFPLPQRKIWLPRMMPYYCIVLYNFQSPSCTLFSLIVQHSCK